ncbi:hypothetical protein AVEN_190116-1 [Araneus ventricosus]|uniref:Uncharacterized protein n=2 Tax=Araneus ventricosus TaxID=182803 RepID=A0A4Y2D8G8_ARAVE|nr:hypothetical protein AVEN_190116-1 [Araneus ventricosus]
MTGMNCPSKKGTSVPMLMCENHLNKYFGLMLKYIPHENLTQQSAIGGFLKPVPGVVFQKYTVIIPDKPFLDEYFRPEDSPNDLDISHYKLNPCIVEFWNHAISRQSRNSHEERFAFEIIRNLNDDPERVDLGPHLKDVVIQSNFLTLLTSKLTIPKTSINKQSIRKSLDNLSFFKLSERTLTELFSLNMLYYLSNCYFSSHHSEAGFLDELPYNAIWVEDIGLVATETIGDPMPIVIGGWRRGSKPYYNSVVSIIQKDIVNKQLTLSNLPKQFGSSQRFRGGSLRCL